MLWDMLLRLVTVAGCCVLLTMSAPVLSPAARDKQLIQSEPIKVTTTTTTTTTTTSMEDMNKAMGYLKQFGYMDPSVETTTTSLDEVDGQVSDIPDQVRDALMMFQDMAGLPLTGELDDATSAKMAMPRCGVPDHVSTPSKGSISRRKRFVVSGSSWPSKSVSYNIASFPRAELGLSNNDVLSTVRRALKFWSDASGITFVETASTSADIQMNFFLRDHGDGSPFDGPGGVLAHAFYPGSGGDLHWDGEENWTVNSSNGINFLYATIHELGHAVGLAHTFDPTAVMAPFYRSYDPNQVLAQDDITGIQNIYGPPSVATSTTTTTTKVPTTTRTTAATTTTTPTTTNAITVTTTTPISRRTTPSLATSTTPQTMVDKSQTNTKSSWCQNPTFDATMVINGVTYIFKGDSYAIINGAGILPGYPRLISSYWPGAPSDIDAALYWADLDQTYFFKGNTLWRYNTGLQLDVWYPKPIGDKFIGLNGKVDAAFIWSGDQDTYFITGNQYYRYNRALAAVYNGYPQPLVTGWSGLPPNVDAAVQSTNGQTYFFSGTNFYRFNDQTRSVDSGYPQQTGPTWLGC